MKKLYTLLAVVATSTLNAQIIFTEIDPDSVVTGLISPSTGDAYFLDMDNNGTDDYELVKVTDPSWDFAYVQSGGAAGTPGTNELIASMGAGIREVHHLDSGDVIGAAGPWELVDGGNLQFVSDFSAMPPPTGLWVGQTDGYFGVRFDSLGTTYYGWVRFGVAADYLTMTIKSYAYESSGGSIVAGAYPVPPPPPCLEPTDLAAGSITINSADLSWTENNAATEWQIQYGLTGFSLGTGTIVDVSSNPYNLGGLVDDTGYDFYVRSVCGPADTSAWSIVQTFTTVLDDAGFGEDENQHVLIYPNPANDVINISFGDYKTFGNLIISDLTGRQVGEYELTGSSEIISITHFSNGGYFWALTTEAGISTGRFEVIR